jgi:hypothetical protein
MRLGSRENLSGPNIDEGEGDTPVILSRPNSWPCSRLAMQSCFVQTMFRGK